MIRALAWLLALVVCLPGLALAQPLALDRLAGRQDLEAQVALLRDPSRTRTLDDVRHARFVDNDGRSLSLGFDASALWLRFRAHNASDAPVRWMLELAEPSLDRIDLYVLHADGRREHFHAGDLVPFATRALPYLNPVFELDSPARDEATYFVRVQSEDVLRTPLRAWTPASYLRDQRLDRVAFVVCLGALFLVALYHVGVFAMVRQEENAWFALVALSLNGVLMALGGQHSQLVFPDSPELSARAVPVTLALATLMVASFSYSTIRKQATLVPLARWVLAVTYGAAFLVLLTLVLPRGLALHGMAMVLMSLGLAGPMLLRILQAYDIPELRFYRVAWWALIVSIPVAVMRYAGWFPDNLATQLALHVGFIGYSLGNSLALAALANRLREQIATLNETLVLNVERLREALDRAEHANENARRATKSRDEFVATMSHELRTPLNTIINIPQGLVREFTRERAARCVTCDAAYLLDEGDVIDACSLCEDCGQTGTLREGVKVTFTGDDARALRFLRKIERSGQHLLTMVNGVLDFSKLEAGRFQLALGSYELGPLLREVVEQMYDAAHAKQVSLVLLSQEGARPPLRGDQQRVRQVMTNLIANAIKFSDEGGVVTIRWTTHHDDELVEVADHGIGIAETDHERIFASFEQVHKGDTRKYGGTGLGLSISRSLVRMHGGDLSVRSELGKGSTFSVRLPREAQVHPTLLERAS